MEGDARSGRTTQQDAAAMVGRIETRQIIKERYPGLLKENEEKFCRKCITGQCTLIPVTLKGGDCPYFRLRAAIDF